MKIFYVKNKIKIFMKFFILLFLVKVTKSDIFHPKSISLSSPLSYNPTPSYHHNDMRMHIKTVLNMKIENSTLDNYVTNYFKLDNPNPSYIFVLPDEKNRTIVMRRSDFSTAIFPNITTINKFKGIFNKKNITDISQKNNHNQHLTENQQKKIELISNLNSEKLINDSHDYNDYVDENDDESLKIVAENVRTEQNFIKTMEEKNEGQDDIFTRNPKLSVTPTVNPKFHFTHKNVKKFEHIFDTTNAGTRKNLHFTKTDGTKILNNDDEYKEDLSEDYNDDNNGGWDSLGLEGWTGDLRSVKEDLSKEKDKTIPLFLTSTELEDVTKYEHTQTLRPRTPKAFSSSLTAISYTNYNSNLKNEKLKFTHHPNPFSHSPLLQQQQRHQHKPIYSNLNTKNEKFNDDKHDQISEQLKQLLSIENQIHRNFTGNKRIKQAKFPITSSRESHKDEDVFIARANNPFGHSTKWKLSNNITTMPDEREGRKKRGVFQLYSMVKCSTGCDPLIYKGYGCYCGFLGSGRALDGIDRCCQRHDNCYSASSCPMFLEYFVPYLWKCYRGRPLCAIDHGEWGGRNSCASRLCECDRILSKCLRRFYCPRKRNVCTTSSWRLFQNFIMDF